MNAFQKESCVQIANHYGTDSQLLMAIEEMSELTKEICKYNRGNDNREKIIDEIADVKIMIEQIEYLFKLSKEVNLRVDYKLQRQLRRIEDKRGDE